VTFKINKADGSRMARPNTQPHGLSYTEISDFDDMISAFENVQSKRTRDSRA
jgi:hypothetical protein